MNPRFLDSNRVYEDFIANENITISSAKSHTDSLLPRLPALHILAVQPKDKSCEIN